MQQEKDDFGENPFLGLDRSRFRDEAHRAGAPGVRGAEAQRCPVRTTPEDDADRQLFLNALGRIAAPATGAPVSPFLLEERRAFKKIRRKRPPREVSVQPVPTPPEEKEDVSLLSEEEAAFARAMREVRPLSGKGRAVVPAPVPPEPPAQAALSLQDFLDGKLEFALSLTGEYLEGHVVGLDEGTMNRLRAGRYSPEAHLDLHGLNAMQAYQALLGFFRNAWYKGLRTVLVVPGRGHNSPDGVGILRDKLQSWLTQDPFKRLVLAFCTARPADGGAGSVYILLRKYRKKGKIYWERRPADPDLF